MIRTIWDLYIVIFDAFAVLFFLIGGIGCLIDYIKEKRSSRSRSPRAELKKNLSLHKTHVTK